MPTSSQLPSARRNTNGGVIFHGVPVYNVQLTIITSILRLSAHSFGYPSCDVLCNQEEVTAIQSPLDVYRLRYEQVPRLWAFTITGDEFSWILPTLGLWFSSLITRDEQDRTWLNNGRPNCYWLTGFFNPQVLGILMNNSAGGRCRKWCPVARIPR